MQQTNTATEIRNIMGKLTAKYYIAEGVIEIKDGNCIVQMLLPPGTKLRVRRGKVPTTK